VQINTEAPGYSPLESEQRITFPVETAIAGLPGLDYTARFRATALQVTVVFKDGTDIYFARQLVNERLQTARSRLPDGSRPNWGRSRRGWGDLPLRRRSQARRAEAGRLGLHARGPAHPAGLGDPAQLRTTPGVTRSIPSAASSASTT